MFFSAGDVCGFKTLSHEKMHGMQNECPEECAVLMLRSTVHVWCPACMCVRRLQKHAFPPAVVIVLGGSQHIWSVIDQHGRMPPMSVCYCHSRAHVPFSWGSSPSHTVFLHLALHTDV
jgi:hypothetical protein